MIQNESIARASPNATAPNGTTIEGAGGRRVTVEEGPVWLAELLYAPPWWLEPALTVAIVALLAAIAYLAWRVVPDLDEAERNELALEYIEHAFVIGAIVAGTVMLRDYASLPYWIDVLGGSTLGFACAETVLRVVSRASSTGRR